MRELEMHKAVRNVMRLLDRIKDFEVKALERTEGELGKQNHEVLMQALAVLAQMLIPFAPHLGEELWLACTGGEGAVEPAWPEAMAAATQGTGSEGRARARTETGSKDRSRARTETVTSAPGAGI
jgi:leucyl-tRNA synthetase